MNDVPIWPEHCILDNQRYGSVCNFSCGNGKQISSPSSARCGIGGHWSEDVNKVICSDGLYQPNCCFLLLFTLINVFLLTFQKVICKKLWTLVKEAMQWSYFSLLLLNGEQIYGRSKNPFQLNAQGQITADRRRDNATQSLLISKHLLHTEWHHLFNFSAPHPIIAPSIEWTAK